MLTARPSSCNHQAECLLHVLLLPVALVQILLTQEQVQRKTSLVHLRPPESQRRFRTIRRHHLRVATFHSADATDFSTAVLLLVA